MTYNRLPPLLSMEDIEAITRLGSANSVGMEDYLAQCERVVEKYINYGIEMATGLKSPVAAVHLARSMFHISAWRYNIDTEDARYKSVITSLASLTARTVFKDAPPNYRTKQGTEAVARTTRYGYALAWHIISEEIKKEPELVNILRLDVAIAEKSSEFMAAIKLLIEHPEASALVIAGFSVADIRRFVESKIDFDIALHAFTPSVNKGDTV